MRRLRLIIATCYVLLAFSAGVLPFLGGPRAYAPLALIPPKQPITLSILVASELNDWIKPAVQAFNTSQVRIQGRQIVVQLRSLGSGDLIDQTTPQTDVIIPASSAWLSQLAQRKPDLTVRETQPIAHSPLVLLTWQDRAPLLFRGAGVDWDFLYAALGTSTSNAWQQLGGKLEWGTVKFGHTNPLNSNSGLGLVLLLAAQQHGNQPLTAQMIQSGAFRDRLRSFEGAVSRPLQTSSSELLNQMLVRGPAAFDVVAVPENLAILTARDRTNLHVVYPSPTVWSDYPYVVLSAADDQQMAARALRDFLLAPAQREQAAVVGLRLDTTSSVNGVPTPPAVTPPSPEVVTTLLELWRTQFNR